jgi:hypothetical protein
VTVVFGFPVDVRCWRVDFTTRTGTRTIVTCCTEAKAYEFADRLRGVVVAEVTPSDEALHWCPCGTCEASKGGGV